MGIRKIALHAGENFHVFNRGVDKRKIFLDDHDFNRFLLLLEYCNSDVPLGHLNRVIDWERKDIFKCRSQATTRLVNIESYCLLPNHFHLLLKGEVENGISIFMQKVCTGYSKYFNKKYKRSGSLFQGKFKSEHVESDMYYLQLLGYVSCNYIVHGIHDTGKYRTSLSNLFINGYDFVSNSTYTHENFKDKASFVKFAEEKALETYRKRSAKKLLEE